jgi:hypothetical protein
MTIYFYDVELYENQNDPTAFLKTPNVRFHQNSSSIPLVDTCRLTDRHTDTITLICIQFMHTVQRTNTQNVSSVATLAPII